MQTITIAIPLKAKGRFSEMTDAIESIVLDTGIMASKQRVLETMESVG